MSCGVVRGKPVIRACQPPYKIDRSWSNLVKSVRGKETCIGCEYNAGNVFCDPCGCKSPKKIADLTRCPLDRWRRPNLPPQKTA